MLHMHREKLSDYIKKHITTGYSRTLLSLAFPQRKIIDARDIRLSFVFSQLASSLALLLSCLGAPLLGLWPLVLALAAYTAVQFSSLIAIARVEPKIGFLLMSYAMFFVRNLAWLTGMAKAVFYVLQSPPELEAAARWRAHQTHEIDPHAAVDAPTNTPPEKIEEAKG